MKLEIEITPEEIKGAIERRVRVAIADQNAAWTLLCDIRLYLKITAL